MEIVCKLFVYIIYAFKKWAIHTGKHREGQDHEDYSGWKTHIRNALHKSPDFEEMKDMRQTESHNNPIRVYVFKDRGMCLHLCLI